MPSLSEPRILLLGDSHLASAAEAVQAAQATDRFEFWGATGSRFRALQVTETGISPSSPEAAAEVQMVNGRGRHTLEKGQFDRVIMVGGRLRSSDFLVPMANHMMQQTGTLSQAVLRVCADKWILSRGVKMAALVCAPGGKVACIPAPLTFQRSRGLNTQRKVPRSLIKSLRQASADAFEAQGMILIHQPMRSLRDDLFTKRQHAAPRYKNDFTHVSAGLMAAMLDRALAAVDAPPLMPPIRAPDAPGTPQECQGHV